jgi:hypothetical protein
MSGGPAWRRDHNPAARPLACNGRYGKSGAERHRREGTTPCRRCKASAAHWAREKRRGGLRPRKLAPCGTPAAANRHRRLGEPVDFACLVAEANYRTELRQRAA